MSMVEYSGKVILAPMVRMNTLPLRLLALEYGADLVYTEEMIDYKLVKCRRVENVALGTIDFIDENHEVILRTLPPMEKTKLIAQIGTCDPERALAASRVVERDVSGIDVNMGCPKSFSLKGGMGAALLSKPDVIHRILTTLVTNLSIPVTCKIRVKESLEETIELVKMIATTGVKAIAVHGRTIKERPWNANRDNYIEAISQAVSSIPIIANGGSNDIQCYADIEKFRQKTNASSVMLAHAAEHNVSIFDANRDELEDIDNLIRKYLRLALKYDNKPQATKYALRHILRERIEDPRYLPLNGYTDHREFCSLWGIENEYEAHCIANRAKQEALQSALLKRKHEDNNEDSGDGENAPMTAEMRLEARLVREGVATMPLIFIKKMWFDDGSRSPKTILHDWYAQVKGFNTIPSYETLPVEKNFISIIHCDKLEGDTERKFASVYMEKSKKAAEQASALVACIKLGLVDMAKIHPAFTMGAIQERTLSNAKYIKTQV